MSPTRPRILEVLYSFGIGGSQLVGLEIAKQLQADGAEVLCAALDSTPGPITRRCADYGLPVVDLGVPWRHPLGRNGVSWGLVRRLRALKLDGIHLQHFLGLNKLGLPARLAGIERVVATEHSVFDVGQSFAGRFRVRLNWRLASSITVVHQGIKDFLCSDLKVPAERVSVIPLGIDVADFDPHDRAARRTELGIGDELAFIFVGRLAPVKNVPQLIEAFLAVQARGASQARLLVVGDGVEMPKARDTVAAHPLGQRVMLLGEQADVRPYLAASDVFVLNSSSEGTPRALLEAMAMGLPTISSAVGNIPEMIAGRGWLTKPGDRASLEQAFQTALSEPSAVREAGRRSRSYVREHYDAQAVGARYRQLLLN
jgi:glycosyltransferase involved in cell wall biosynthesis